MITAIGDSWIRVKSPKKSQKLYEPEQVDEERAVVVADRAGSLQGMLCGKHRGRACGAGRGRMGLILRGQGCCGRRLAVV